MHVVIAQFGGEDGLRRQSRAERPRDRSPCAKWRNKQNCQGSRLPARCRVKRWRVRINPCPASLARVSTLTISRLLGIIWVPRKDSNDQIRWQDDWRWVRVTRPVNQWGKNRMLATSRCARTKTIPFLGSGGWYFPAHRTQRPPGWTDSNAPPLMLEGQSVGDGQGPVPVRHFCLVKDEFPSLGLPLRCSAPLPAMRFLFLKFYYWQGYILALRLLLWSNSHNHTWLPEKP